jgi:hypothetical protein
MWISGWYGAIADEGAEYCDDGGLVAWGVFHHALESVDAT